MEIMQRQDTMPFWKMSGSGNDFVVIDNRDDSVAPDRAAEFTRAVCRHRISVGADGVVLIERSADAGIAYNWRYINADGSDGEMCGNGAMCGARFAVLNGIAPVDHRFRTESGVVHATVANDPADPRVRIAVADPGPLGPEQTIDVCSRAVTLRAILVGVPHVVIVAQDVDAFAPGEELVSLGRAIRHHPTFAPAGTNVNLIAGIDAHSVRIRTYERGVEDETLACGTGAIASAIVATRIGWVTPPVDVVTTSGRTLTVAFRLDSDCAGGVTLTGEARVIVRGEIDSEALR
jgi:diaminopimelate epimerase